MDNSRGTILVVDDETGIRKVLETSLSRAGFTVFTAGQAEEAEQLLEQHPIDVVLLDVRMPGKSGLVLLPEIHQKYPFTAIVMVTAVGDTETAVACMKMGALDYLLKPFDMQKLIATIERSLSYVHLLREKERLEKLKEDLTYMIIHDIRNELSPILSVLELISMSKDLDEKDKQFLKAGTDATLRLANMTNSLLEVEKLEKGEMELKKEKVLLEKLLEEVSEAFRPALEQKKIKLVTNIKNHTAIFVDREIIHRVLFNLFHNAHKFTPKEGKITAQIWEEENSVFLSLTDTGPGVPEEFQKKIFEKFASAELHKDHSRRGIGLGLAFCKLAVEAHGGKIWVEGKKEEGATFVLRFPVQSTPS